MNRRIRIGLVALALCVPLLLGGCHSTSDSQVASQTQPGAPVPPFTLKLRCATTNNRFSNFQITTNGFLSYAGGKTAMIGEVNPVRMLTPAERARIVALVDQYKLEDAPNAFFRKSQKVDYIFSFNRGLLGVTIESVDDETPGFKELHDLLMELVEEGR